MVTKEGTAGDAVLSDVNASLLARFGIDHTTIQIEPEGFEEHDSCE